MSGLNWVETVCNGYQQTTLGGKELKASLTLFILMDFPKQNKYGIVYFVFKGVTGQNV